MILFFKILGLIVALIFICLLVILIGSFIEDTIFIIKNSKNTKDDDF